MNRERILKISRDQIRRMASAAGVYIYEGNSFAEDCYLNLLDDVAAAVAAIAAAEEREACAVVCDERAAKSAMGSDEQCEAEDCAAAIRERGNT